jgi:hypothetical protein
MDQYCRLFGQIKIPEALFSGSPCGRIPFRVERVELDTVSAVHESRPADSRGKVGTTADFQDRNYARSMICHRRCGRNRVKQARQWVESLKSG